MYIVIPTGFLYSIKWIQKTTFIKLNLHQHYSKKLADLTLFMKQKKKKKCFRLWYLKHVYHHPA